VAQVGHNKSPMVLGQFAVGSDCVNSGLHGASPGSILLLASVSVWVFSVHTQGTKMLFLLFLFFCLPSEEVPRHSQTRRDQVGTSNWVEALQILTHLLIYIDLTEQTINGQLLIIVLSSTLYDLNTLIENR